MNKNDISIVSLSDMHKTNEVKAIQKNNGYTEITDLAILTGAHFLLKDNKANSYSVITTTGFDNRLFEVAAIIASNEYTNYHILSTYGTIRPIIKLANEEYNKIISDIKTDSNGDYIITYGEYPQKKADKETQKTLDNEYYNNNLRKTGRIFTFNQKIRNESFEMEHEEYEFNGKRYIKVKPDMLLIDEKNAKQALGIESDIKSYYWVEVLPITWFVNKKTKQLISEKGLLAGIEFDNKEYHGLFKKTTMYSFLKNKMLPDILAPIHEKIQTKIDFSIYEEMIENISPEDKKEYINALQELKNNSNIAKKRQ